jgi:two-component system chemotaxis response regulator CheY
MAKTIMIIDNSVSLRLVVGIGLHAAGYEVIEACDSKDALSKLNGTPIYLMICEVNMPNLDGIGFLKALREHPNYKHTPIIMLTTESGEEKRHESRAAGVQGWVVKPFNFEQLLLAIDALVLT